MCLPLIDKVFRGGHRRRNNTTASPRPSLAPTPQQSSATIQTANTPNTPTLVVTNRSLDTSAVAPQALNTLENTASTNRAGVSAVSQVQGTAAAAAHPSKPTSWWDYLGISRSKKDTIDSL